MISASVVLFVVAALGLGAYRLFVDFKNTRDIIVAEDNLRALHTAALGYAGDWDNTLPLADKWTDQVTGYLSAPPNTPGGKLSYLHGEDARGQALHYVYNDLASGYKLERVTPQEQRTAIDPGRMVLFIEMPGEGANAHVRIPPRNTPEGEDALAKTAHVLARSRRPQQSHRRPHLRQRQHGTPDTERFQIRGEIRDKR